MAEYITAEKKNEIFAKYGGDQKNTGSAEGQIALFTYRIKGLAAHLESNKKDHACRRALLSLVGKRKRLLKYLADKDIVKYRELLTDLGIRK
ncbi:MAG: 30S ribosomal protein S15 [Flavobacteriales bacterium]|nr:30S ribosomal protein S15 [Flavobacteriales bacterium]